MKQFVFQIIVLMIVLFLATFITFNKDFQAKVLYFLKPQQNIPSNQTKTVKIESQNGETKVSINAEIANTGALRTLGLGGRESLAKDSGMLFTYEEPAIYRYWMKGMRFPLDFIWVNNKKIVDLTLGVEPPGLNTSDTSLKIYTSTIPVDTVLEVNSGFVKSHNITIGDKLSF